MLNEKKIIYGCKKSDKNAQRILYEQYSPLMRGLCQRYIGSASLAEDIMHEGFIKVFTNINQYKGIGSFEGWIKRIMINTSISYIKNNEKHNRSKSFEEISELHIKSISEDYEIDTENVDAKSLILHSDFSKEEIMEVVRELPDGYRMVFNLYVLENYKHKEIAQLLSIDINTSKSQLARARKLIQKRLLLIVHSKIKQLKSSRLYE